MKVSDATSQLRAGDRWSFDSRLSVDHFASQNFPPERPGAGMDRTTLLDGTPVPQPSLEKLGGPSQRRRATETSALERPGTGMDSGKLLRSAPVLHSYSEKFSGSSQHWRAPRQSSLAHFFARNTRRQVPQPIGGTCLG